ncbi:MAG: TIGR00730 family Rossman fold protein [Bacteroidetes bacterium]|nr:MAG: TIGR00730 family Rossman fold protein [Bacteroidota bacterium]
MTKILKAYENLEFLNSPSARILRIMSEFVEPHARFEKQQIKDTVVFFGSARLKSKEEAEKGLEEIKKESTPDVYALHKAELALKNSRYYEDAVELSRRVTQWSMKNYYHNGRRYVVCTGGGPGIMEAANRGAHLAGGKSIGLNISLPFEQYANPYLEDELNFEFHYFFMRKFWFAYPAKAIVIFPGGFGTLDELAEILTLVQTGKIKKEMKILIYDKKYWEQIINFEKFAEFGMISPEDLKLFTICDTVDEMEQHLMEHFENVKDKEKLM